MPPLTSAALSPPELTGRRLKAFVWNARFETGISSIDQQHRRLVDAVNRVGEALIDGGIPEDELASIFLELARYAKIHFADEERLMDQSGLDLQHIESHRLHHRQFVEQVTQMWKMRATLAHPGEVLHGFLTSWLSFHILEEDQAMVRQKTLIEQGVPAAQAYARQQQPADNSSAVLLDAMRELYRVLSLQNENLLQANEQLEAKVRDRTRDLLQSEKMAAIGQLAAGVAHEINNPIGFVNSNLGSLKGYVAQLLRLIDDCTELTAAHPELAAAVAEQHSKVDLPYIREDLTALLQESSEGLDRVKSIVQSLKDFAHADNAERVQTDLLAGLESTLNVAWNELKYKAEVVRELEPLPLVPCVPGQINQVFMNLLVNAAQAIDRRGLITLRSGRDEHGVWVSISDNGCGMSDETCRHVFEPFFTTKPVGKGTGLGLSVSWDIVVNKHGGRISVQSQPGTGSTFTVWIPLVPALA